MLSVTKLDETRLIFVLASSGRRGPRFKSGLPDITGFRLRKPVFFITLPLRRDNFVRAAKGTSQGLDCPRSQERS